MCICLDKGIKLVIVLSQHTSKVLSVYQYNQYAYMPIHHYYIVFRVKKQRKQKENSLLAVCSSQKYIAFLKDIFSRRWTLCQLIRRIYSKYLSRSESLFLLQSTKLLYF